MGSSNGNRKCNGSKHHNKINANVYAMIRNIYHMCVREIEKERVRERGGRGTFHFSIDKFVYETKRMN